MDINATLPRQAHGRPPRPWRLPEWGAFLLLILLAASAVPLFHAPVGSAGAAMRGPGAGSAVLPPSFSTTEGAPRAVLSSGARAPQPGPSTPGSPPLVSLEQAFGGIGIGGLAVVGFSLRFRKRKEERTASPPSSGQGSVATSQSPSTGGNAGSAGSPGPVSPSKTVGGLSDLPEAAPAPPLPDVSPLSTKAQSGAGPTPLVVPIDQAVCPLCGGPLSGLNAPCPKCTPSLVPGPNSVPLEAGLLPEPGSKSPSPDVSSPAAGDGRRGMPSVLPPTPSPATTRCMVCGGPLKEGYCPVCGMRWSD